MSKRDGGPAEWIKPQTAVVYKTTSGKRYFTIDGALRHEGWLKVKARYDADTLHDKYYCPDGWEGVMLDMVRVHALLKRYARRYRCFVPALAQGEQS